MSRNRRIDKAIAAIPDDAWTPVHYPGAVLDPDTGALISDAEVAETSYTAFSGRHRVTARLIVRRVKDANHPDGLFPVWRHHPFLTNSDLPAAGTLAGGRFAVARGATLRRDLVNVPARFAAPARRPMLHLPAHWRWQTQWMTLWHNVIDYP